MKKPATIKTVAERAGVSPATVSRVLNNNVPVRGATRDRVLKAAQELHYTPNILARALSAKRTDTIGVILPDLSGEFFSEVIRGIDEVAYRQGYHIIVSSSHSHRNEVQAMVQMMAQGRVDGLILMEPLLGKRGLPILAEYRFPVVLLNFPLEGFDGDTILVDNLRGAYLVTKHLLDHGYQPLAMIRGPVGNYDADTREAGFRAALKEKGLGVETEGVVYLERGNFSRRSGYLAMIRLLSLPIRPRAVFAANDEMAIGAFDAVWQHGLHIPEDIAIVGFDDIDVASCIRPTLTTVHVPIAELGAMAAQKLISAIKNPKEDGKPSQRTLLPTGLVIRESCGCSNQSRILLSVERR